MTGGFQSFAIFGPRAGQSGVGHQVLLAVGNIFSVAVVCLDRVREAHIFASNKLVWKEVDGWVVLRGRFEVLAGL